jgi:sugar O-acyltransferase (sialic acid O-acetyltransferase NeuD family)
MIKTQQMNVLILGCSQYSSSIIFDMLYEIYGMQEFTIIPNKELGIVPELPVKGYRYHLTSFETISPNIEQPYFFGTSTPVVKATIYNDFADKYSIYQPSYVKLIHPSAYVSPSCLIENGVLVEPHAVISSQSKIGFGVHIKRTSSIGHHNIIGEYCDINPGTVISGNVTIGKGTIIGSGTTVRDNISIGSNCVIGIGSVVTKNIPDNSIAFGNPCKIIKENTAWNSL